MAQNIHGYLTAEAIRKVCGSPATNYILGSMASSVIVDVLDRVNGIYVAFNGATAGTGSTSLFIPPAESRAFDLRTGSVSVLGSAATTPEVQVIGLHD